jgi:hypothetical protein
MSACELGLQVICSVIHDTSSVIMEANQEIAFSHFARSFLVLAQTNQQQPRTMAESSVKPWILKVVLVYGLLLVVRQVFHGDAAYYSVNFLMPVFKWAASMFHILLGYKPTIISMLEAVACGLCVQAGFHFTPKLCQAVTRPPVPAAHRPARGTFTRQLLVLFVFTPAIYFAICHFRPIDPHKIPTNEAQGLIGHYVSNRVVSGADGQLTVCTNDHCVSEVSEEEYQNNKVALASSSPSAPVSSKPKDSDKKKQKAGTSAVVAFDIRTGQDPWAVALLKDLSTMQFVFFCGMSLLCASVGSFFI